DLMGLSVRFNLSDERPLMGMCFLLFLLSIGFVFLQMIAHQSSSMRKALGLPQRPTATQEWGIGAAIGWGLVVLAIIPMALGALFTSSSGRRLAPSGWRFSVWQFLPSAPWSRKLPSAV